MKKFVILSILFTLALHAAAQYDMSIWMNGSNTTYTTSEVDSITFKVKESSTDPIPKGPFYITGNEVLFPTNSWQVDAIQMPQEGKYYTHTFWNVPAGSYCQFKITIGDWSQNWGFAAVANPPAGVSGDMDGNVVFTMASTSDVKVTFDGTNISLTGDFVGGSTPTPDPEPEPEPEPSGDITVKAQVPASWTNTITAWVWPTGGEGREIVPTKEGKWYVITETCSELNIIFKNGIGWNGDYNQTEDMTFTENTCIAITTGMEKATYTVVDCEGSITPEPEPEPEPINYYIGGNTPLIGNEMWDPKAITMTKVGDYYTHTFKNVPAGQECKFKITDGTWNTTWGHSELVYSPIATTGSNSNNIVFTLTAQANIHVYFDGSNIHIEVEYTNNTPEAEPVIGPYYITGNEVLVGSDLAWKADAIKMTQDGNVVTHTFTNLPANEECQFKITNGDWSLNWGFEDVANPPAGVSVDINLHGNVVFYLSQPGNVTVTFDGNNISLTGNFRSW